MNLTRRDFAAQRVQGFGETVFAKYTRLAKDLGAINLGQGFPDFEPPEFVMAAYREAAGGYQQYPPLPGWPPLLEVLAETIGARLGRRLDPQVNLQIVVGATEGLFAAMQALVDPGDEVIVLEPFYDAYPADITMAGGVPRYVPLEPQTDGRWLLDFERLEAACSPKTKALILNTPHNPTGKVFKAEDLDRLIALAERHDFIVVSDEVYEHIAFEPQLPLASRPGGWERSLSISSVGKTFSVTGWKVGWCVGPEGFISALRKAHQWIPFTVATPLQAACAQIIREAARPENSYYKDVAALYRTKRDLLVAALRETPLTPLRPEGSYFLVANSQALDYEDDIALCDDLPRRVGVVAIPPSAFYSEAHKHLAKHLVRFAFCKTDEALGEAAERLKQL